VHDPQYELFGELAPEDRYGGLHSRRDRSEVVAEAISTVQVNGTCGMKRRPVTGQIVVRSLQPEAFYLYRKRVA